MTQHLVPQKTISKHAGWGAWLWVGSLQYYIAQLVVATAWLPQPGYSWRANTISDLANTHCGLYGVRAVCSPLHALMNASFILLGISMIGGAHYLAHELSANRKTWVGFICMAVAGVGTIVVGLFPENTVATLHVLGAALPFLLGNIGILLLALGFPHLPMWFKLYSVLLGSAALVALGLFLSQHYLGLGEGGMERVVSYPQSIWMISFGTYLLHRRHDGNLRLG